MNEFIEGRLQSIAQAADRMTEVVPVLQRLAWAVERLVLQQNTRTEWNLKPCGYCGSELVVEGAKRCSACGSEVQS